MKRIPVLILPLALFACATTATACGAGRWEVHAKAALMARQGVTEAQTVTKAAHHDAVTEVIEANADAEDAVLDAAAVRVTEEWDPLYESVNLLTDTTNAYVSAVATAVELEDQGIEAAWDDVQDVAVALVRAWGTAVRLAESLGVGGFPAPPDILTRITEGSPK